MRDLRDVPEEEVVRLAKEGDMEALEELYRRFRPLVLSLARRVWRGYPDFEDVVQQGWLEFFSFLERYRDGEGVPFRGAVSKVVSKRLKGWVLREARRSLPLRPFDFPVPQVTEEDVRDIETFPPTLPEGFVEILSPREREVLELWMKGNGIKKTARMLGVTPSTVARLRRRVLKKAKGFTPKGAENRVI